MGMPSVSPAKPSKGTFQQIEYQFPKTASKAQVVRNMNTALHRAGYTFHYDSGDYGDFGAHMGKMWIQIEIGGGGMIKETFVEETTLTQDVVANGCRDDGRREVHRTRRRQRDSFRYRQG